MSLTVGIAVAFGALMLAFMTLGDLVLERRQVFRSLRALRRIELSPKEVRQKELALPFVQRVLAPALRRIGRFGQRMTPAGVVDRLSRELVYAGSPPGWDAERILALKLIGVAALGAGMIVLGRLARLAGFRSLILAGLFAFIGYYVPEWLLRGQSGKRQEAIRRSLPDSLDLLSITVEAGLGFDAALSRVAREEGGPLGEEFHRVLQEMQIGKTRSDAFRDMGDRTTVPELRSFVLAMIQADVFGISVGKVLHVQAHEMRLKRRQRAEEKAQKVPVKIIFPLIFCIFPSLLVVLLGPAVIQIRKAFLR